MSYIPSTVWASGFIPPIDWVILVTVTPSEKRILDFIAANPDSNKHDISKALQAPIEAVSVHTYHLSKKKLLQYALRNIRHGRGTNNIKHYSVPDNAGVER